MAAGVDTVRARAGGVEGFAVLTFTVPTVARVVVSPRTATREAGDTLRLRAEAQSASGQVIPGRAVAWATLDPAVASVDAQGGLVTMLGVGTARIAATVDGVADTATLTGTAAAVAQVVIVEGAATRRTGETVAFTAHALDARGAVLAGRAIGWTSLDGAVASVEGAGLVRANAVGVARIVADADGRRDTVTVTVTPWGVASVTLPAAVAMMSVGRTFEAAGLRRDAQGGVLVGPAINYTSSASGVASVDATGRLTAVAPGTARIIAAAEGRADTLDVTVQSGGAIVAALSDTVLAEGRVLTMVGSGLSGASVTVHGVTAAVTASADDRVQFTVPSALFAPCLPAGVRYTLAISAQGGTASRSLPAAETPLVATLAPGQYLVATEAQARGCAVEVAGSGVFVAMPFTWEDGATPVRALEAELRVTSGGALLTGGASAVGAGSFLRADRAAPALRRTVSRSVVPAARRPDWRIVTPGRFPLRPSSRGATGSGSVDHAGRVVNAVGACTVPTTVGQTMEIGTGRGSNGEVSYLTTTAGGGRLEAWRAASVSATATVLVDSTLWRVMQGNATLAGEIASIAAAYDSTIFPLFNQYGNGMPDKDGNGRLAILLPYTSTGVLAYAYPQGFAYSGCGPDIGEAVFVPVSAPQNLAGTLATIVHEAHHVAEIPATQASAGQNRSWWFHEAYAELGVHMWMVRGNPAPFTSELGAVPAARFGTSESSGPRCLYPVRAPMPAAEVSYGDSRLYAAGCHYLRFLVGRLAADGMSQGDAARRLLGLTNTRTFAHVGNGVRHQNRPASEVLGEFFASWVADGVPGTVPGLQDPGFQVGAAWAPWTAHGRVVESTLAAGSVVALTLREPDVRHYELRPAGGALRVRYAAPDGSSLPATQTQLLILRPQ